MKGIIASVVFVGLLGVGAFAYRNYIEKPEEMYTGAPLTTATSSPACTQDAKVCPDGSAVGRTGPDCSFAACPPPNAAFTVGSTTLGFVVPSGYELASSTGDQSILAQYQQSGMSAATASVITVSAYAVPAGDTPGQIMLEKTVFDPSGLQATSTSSFSNITEGSNIFSAVQIGNSDGIVETAYYITTPSDVFRFDIEEQGVASSSDPNLNPSTLPQHETLLQMLATLQVSSS